MTFKFNNFKVFIDNHSETLPSKIIAPQKVLASKPSDYEVENKTRDTRVFRGLNFLENRDNKYYRVISDTFIFIDLIEILKAFSSNKLDTEKTYSIEDSFKAKIVQKNGKIYLDIHFKNFSNHLYLDKFEASSLSAKFNKILTMVVAWQEQEV